MWKHKSKKLGQGNEQRFMFPPENSDAWATEVDDDLPLGCFTRSEIAQAL